ncbi:MAG TPA: NAD(P)H-dependent oxidoreductase [Edaphocola sp.]|nr:NAD(P)H-dependent oxidoreductase [Edaphocola sp.]
MRHKILAISGSTRKNSTNEIILETISGLFRDSLEVDIYNRIDELPHFNPDLDNEAPSPPVMEFRRLIEQADGVLICTPEYVFSLPGALKNALEWTVSTTLFSFKPLAFIMASASGEKAFESLDLIMKTLLQEPVKDNCKLLIKGGRGKINREGRLADAATLGEIKKTISAFVDQLEHKAGLH